MKKVIFEGTVDGVKFDNNKEYEEVIAKAIAEGKNVQASSNTRIVDVADEEEDSDVKTAPKDCPCNCNHQKHSAILTLPGFTFDPKTNEYIERLYDDFKEFLNPEKIMPTDAFVSKLEEMNNMMDSIWDEIFDSPCECNLAKCAHLIGNIHNILDTDAGEVKECIDSDTEDIHNIQEEIKELQDELEDLKRDLTIQRRYAKILSEYHNFYERMKEELVKRNFDVNETADTHTETTERSPQHEFDLNKISAIGPTANLVEDILMAKNPMEHPMMKLLTEIFK